MQLLAPPSDPICLLPQKQSIRPKLGMSLLLLAIAGLSVWLGATIRGLWLVHLFGGLFGAFGLYCLFDVSQASIKNAAPLFRIELSAHPFKRGHPVAVRFVQPGPIRWKALDITLEYVEQRWFEEGYSPEENERLGPTLKETLVFQQRLIEVGSLHVPKDEIWQAHCDLVIAYHLPASVRPISWRFVVKRSGRVSAVLFKLNVTVSGVS